MTLGTSAPTIDACDVAVDSGGHNAVTSAMPSSCVGRSSTDVTYADGSLGALTQVDASYAVPSVHTSGEDTTIETSVRRPSGNLLGNGSRCSAGPDQTGAVRGAACDIGPYEVSARETPANTPPTTIGIPDQSGKSGALLATPLDDYFDDAETPDDLTYSATIRGAQVAVADYSIDSSRLLQLDLSEKVQSATDTVVVTAADPQGDSVSTAFRVTVTYAGPAVLNDDEYTVTAGSSLSVDADHGLYANDLSNPSGTYTIWDPTSGSTSEPAAIDADLSDGSFTFTPPKGFSGDLTYAYGIPGNSDETGHVTFHVIADPVAVDDAYRVAVSSQFVTIPADRGLLVNDSGAPAGGVDFVEIDKPAQKGITVSTNTSDGAFQVDAYFAGTYTFRYRFLTDAGTSNYATVTVTASTPDPVDDGVYVVDEDQTLSVSVNNGLRSNDTDDTGVPLNVTDSPDGGTITSMNKDGSFTYKPNPGYTGTDTFTYGYECHGCDGTATVTIDVVHLNHAPTVGDPSYTTDEETTLTVTDPENGLLGTAHDADGDKLTVQPGLRSTLGSIDVHSDGTFTVTPAPNIHGTEKIPFTVSDGTTTASGTMTLTVTSVDDPPKSAADVYATFADESLTVSAADGVLANDSDVDTDHTALTAHKVSGPAHGSLALGAAGSFTYRPDTDFHGTDSFTYRVDDGQGGRSAASKVSIVVAPHAIHGPSAKPDSYTDRSGGKLRIAATDGVLANDTAQPSQTGLHVRLVDAPAHGNVTLKPDGSFTYTPNAGYTGKDSFTYQAIATYNATTPVQLGSAATAATIDLPAAATTGLQGRTSSAGASPSQRDGSSAGSGGTEAAQGAGGSAALADTGVPIAARLRDAALLLLVGLGLLVAACRRARR